MNEDTRVRDTVATIVTTLIDVHRHGGDADVITTGLLREFDVLLETKVRAARAMIAFASLSADALALSAEILVPNPGDKQVAKSVGRRCS